MADYGFKIAQPGYDVKTCAKNQLAISSAFNSWKIFAQGTLTQVVAGSLSFPGYSIKLVHNLGYAPMFYVFGENLPGDGTRYKSTYSISLANVSVYAYIDNTTLHINVAAGQNATGTVNLYYYIFKDPVQTTGNANVGSSSNYGLKISQPGYDVKTCTDDQLVFSSKFNTLKEYVSGTINTTGGSNSPVLTTIYHGLGYAPAYLVFAYGGDGYWYPQLNTGTQYANDYRQVEAWSDANNLYLNNLPGTGGYTTVQEHFSIFKDEVQ